MWRHRHIAQADLLFLKDGSMLISDDFNGRSIETYESATVGT